MPAALVASLADAADITIDEAERRWKKAKAITEQQTGMTEGDGEDFWKYVTGVFKKALGITAVTESATADDIHAAAHEAATSPLNDLPHPTQAQLEAGNYAKGHFTYHGLPIAIENPKGSKRRGVSPDGKAWESEMQHHYGYIKGTVGRDKDHLDVFIGDIPHGDFVAVVDQVDPKTRRFDEHKIMLGFPSVKEARAAYLANYEPGWKGLGATTGMTMAMFKIWLKEMDTTKPMEDRILESAVNVPAPQEWKIDKKGEHYPYEVKARSLRTERWELHTESMNLSFIEEWLRSRGVTPSTVKGFPGAGAGGRFLTEADLRWRGKIAGATSFADIQEAFALKWPGIIDPPSRAKVIATFRNDEDGTEARVAEVEQGYSVTLLDLDSGKVVPVASIYPDRETAIIKAKEAAGVINSLTYNSEGDIDKASTNAEDAMEKGFWARQGTELSPKKGKAVNLLNERGFRVFAYSHEINRQNGMHARTETRYRVLTGTGVEVFSNNSWSKVEEFADQIDTNGTFSSDLEYMGEGRAAKADGRVENDGFFGEWKGTAFYLEKLKELGAPEELLQIARDFTSGKKINNVMENEDKTQQNIVRWDGADLYYFEKGDWGFQRIQITPSNGYVDFGYAHADTTPPPDPSDLDAKQKEWERSHDRKGAPTLSTSRAVDAMVRSGFSRDEFRVRTEQKNGVFGDTTINTYVKGKVVERTEDLLRNGLGVTWYVTKERITALVAPENEWHSAEAHRDYAGKPGTLTVIDVDKFDNREPGAHATFGPDNLDKANAMVAGIQNQDRDAKLLEIAQKFLGSDRPGYNVDVLYMTLEQNKHEDGVPEMPWAEYLESTSVMQQGPEAVQILADYFDEREGKTAAPAPDKEYYLRVRVTKTDGEEVTAGDDDFGPSQTEAEAIEKYRRFLDGIKMGLYPDVESTGSAWIEDETGKVVNESLPEPEQAKPAPVAVPKNPKTGPQRVMVLRTLTDIPGLQEYIAAVDAATTKKELRVLDRELYERIPTLRGNEQQIGGLSLFWTVHDLINGKERELNKAEKDAAAARKTEKEQAVKEKKEREDLQLKRYKERPELKKVLDLLAADFRPKLVAEFTARVASLVKSSFDADGNFNQEKLDPRKASTWEWQARQMLRAELGPYMVRDLKLNPNWEQISQQRAEQQANDIIQGFENKMAWKLGEVLERKGGGTVEMKGRVDRDHAIRMNFPDGSGFSMKTQQVIARSKNNVIFARYPTTFHDVVLPGGEKMATPSVAKMQAEFGITEDSTEDRA